jgi:protein-tyrosine phosphatase
VLRPRGGDWLADETKSWRESGFDAVVSLLERDEEATLDLEGEAAAAVTSGMEFRSFPVPDRGIPVSHEAAATLVHGIVEALDLGRTVVVHCRQGIGRSALIAGAVLVAEGEDVEAALRTIKQSRGLEGPETDEQRQWLHDFASRMAGEPAV